RLCGAELHRHRAGGRLRAGAVPYRRLGRSRPEPRQNQRRVAAGAQPARQARRGIGNRQSAGRQLRLPHRGYRVLSEAGTTVPDRARGRNMASRFLIVCSEHLCYHKLCVKIVLELCNGRHAERGRADGPHQRTGPISWPFTPLTVKTHTGGSERTVLTHSSSSVATTSSLPPAGSRSRASTGSSRGRASWHVSSTKPTSSRTARSGSLSRL